MTKEGYVDVELDLDQDVIDALEAIAKQRNITVSEVVEEALTEFMNSKDPNHRERFFDEDTH